MELRSSVAVAGVIGVALIVGAQMASASCVVPHESADYVARSLKGEQAGEGLVYAEPGEVLAVVERETILVWEAIPSHTSASATVVVRYWGDPADSTFETVIDGGEPTASSGTTTSCDPSVARSVGDRELGVIFSVAGYTPLIEKEFTDDQEAAFTEYLGNSVVAELPPLSTAHPKARTVTSATSRTVVFVAVTAGLTAAGLVGWWLFARNRNVAGNRPRR